MEPSKAVKEYKAELIKAQNKRLTTLVGKVMVEKEWLAKKARQLNTSSTRLVLNAEVYWIHFFTSIFVSLVWLIRNKKFSFIRKSYPFIFCGVIVDQFIY
jgi:hypothetical protein